MCQQRFYTVGFGVFLLSSILHPLLPPPTFPLKVSSPTATPGGEGVQSNFLLHLSISSLFPYSFLSPLFLSPPKTGKRKVLTPAASDSYQITLSTVRMHTLCNKLRTDTFNFCFSFNSNGYLVLI